MTNGGREIGRQERAAKINRAPRGPKQNGRPGCIPFAAYPAHTPERENKFPYREFFALFSVSSWPDLTQSDTSATGEIYAALARTKRRTVSRTTQGRARVGSRERRHARAVAYWLSGQHRRLNHGTNRQKKSARVSSARHTEGPSSVMSPRKGNKSLR